MSTTVNELDGKQAQGPDVELQPEEDAANDTDRDSQETQQGQLAETSDPLINTIQQENPNGLTLVLYGPTTKEMPGGYSNTNNNREFTTQAKGMAEIHNSTGVRDGSLQLGVAVPALSKSGIEEATKRTYDTVLQRYQAAKPENAPDEPENLKIKNLSLFYHGGQNALYLPGSNLTTTNVSEFVSSTGYALRNDVFVQLYACSAARGENSLSEVMAEELGGDANVFGHTTAAHTTENSNARVFGTLGEGTGMLDVIFPEAFIDAEVERIWGADLDAGKKAAARAKLVERISQYYKRVFGLRGGWNDSAKMAYRDAEVQESGYYASRGLRVPGREMFIDPEGMAEEAQTRWVDYAAQSERQRFNAIAPVSADFGSAAGGITVAPEQGASGGDRTSGGSNTNAPTTSPRPRPRPANMGAAEVNAYINVMAAVNYNKSRPYSDDQWREIQREVQTEDDGIPGPNTARAVAAWQASNDLVVDGKVGPATLRKLSEVGSVNQNTEQPQVEGETQQEETTDSSSGEVPAGNVTANFAWSEFACRDGTPVPREYQQNVITLCEQLEEVRKAAGNASIKVNSGYRTPSHNRAVGGASGSQHLVAKASDINISGKTPSQVKAIIERLIREGKIRQGGIGLYNSFVHYDTRGSRARW